MCRELTAHDIYGVPLGTFGNPNGHKTRLCRRRLPDDDEGSEAPDNSSRGKALFIPQTVLALEGFLLVL